MQDHVVTFKDSLKSPTDTDNQSSSDESYNGDDIHSTPFKMTVPTSQKVEIEERKESFQEIMKFEGKNRSHENPPEDRSQSVVKDRENDSPKDESSSSQPL